MKVDRGGAGLLKLHHVRAGQMIAFKDRNSTADWSHGPRMHPMPPNDRRMSMDWQFVLVVVLVSFGALASLTLGFVAR